MDRKEPDFNAKAQRRRDAKKSDFCAFASPRLCVEIWAFQPVRCSREAASERSLAAPFEPFAFDDELEDDAPAIDDEPAPAPPATAPPAPPARAPSPTRLPVARSDAAALTPPPEAAARIHAALCGLEAAGDVGTWTETAQINLLFQTGVGAQKNVATICLAITKVAAAVRAEIVLGSGATLTRSEIASRLCRVVATEYHVDEPAPEPPPIPRPEARPRLPAPPRVRPPQSFVEFGTSLAPDITALIITPEERAELDDLAALLPKRGPDPPA